MHTQFQFDAKQMDPKKSSTFLAQAMDYLSEDCQENDQALIQ